jgi:hypothetical protein
MRDSDGFDLAEIPWFNSGLFDAADCLPLGSTELRLARILDPLRAARTSSGRPGLPSTAIDSRIRKRRIDFEHRPLTQEVLP